MNDRNYKVSGKKMLPKKGIREGYYAKKLRRIEEREPNCEETVLTINPLFLAYYEMMEEREASKQEKADDGA